MQQGYPISSINSRHKMSVKANKSADRDCGDQQLDKECRSYLTSIQSWDTLILTTSSIKTIVLQTIVYVTGESV